MSPISDHKIEAPRESAVQSGAAWHSVAASHQAGAREMLALQSPASEHSLPDLLIIHEASAAYDKAGKSHCSNEQIKQIANDVTISMGPLSGNDKGYSKALETNTANSALPKCGLPDPRSIQQRINDLRDTVG